MKLAFISLMIITLIIVFTFIVKDNEIVIKSNYQTYSKPGIGLNYSFSKIVRHPKRIIIDVPEIAFINKSGESIELKEFKVILSIKPDSNIRGLYSVSQEYVKLYILSTIELYIRNYGSINTKFDKYDLLNYVLTEYNHNGMYGYYITQMTIETK